MNYTTIADADPGGDLQAAYDALVARKVSTTDQVRITDVDMARELGFGKAIGILDGIQTAIDANALPARVMRWIEQVGLDINHTGTVNALSNLVPTYISASDATDLQNMGKVAEFPGLTIKDLEKARRLRSEGKA